MAYQMLYSFIFRSELLPNKTFAALFFSGFCVSRFDNSRFEPWQVILIKLLELLRLTIMFVLVASA